MEFAISDTCRACLCNVTQDGMRWLSFVSPGIRQVFVECTSIKIPMIDALPQQICSSCYEKCMDWQAFKKLSHLANKKLLEEIVVEIPESSSSEMDYEDNNNNQEELEEVEDKPKIPVVLLEKLEMYKHSEEAVEDEQEMSQCPVCKAFIPTSGFKLHIKGHVSNKNPKCPICKKKFQKTFSVYRHLTMIHGQQKAQSKKYQRYSDDDAYSSDSSSSSSSSSEDNSFSSSPPVSEDEEQPKEKAPRHLHGKFMSCATCDKAFGSLSKLKRHLRTKTHRENRKWRRTGEEKPFECPCCELRFVQPKNVTNHIMRAHKTISPIGGIVNISGNFKCPLCATHYSDNFESFKNHIFAAHVGTASNDEEEKISCPKCKIGFENGKDLLDHLFIRHLECLLWCNNCKYQHKRPSLMEMHLNEKHDIDIKMCPICGKWTKSLDLHLRIHMPNECVVCSKTFTTANGLKGHMVLHEPKICGICDYKFPCKESLTKHIEMIHLSSSDIIQVD